MAAGLVGAALFYGDGVITPAISVLSAVEGLKVATPLFEPYVIPIALVLLVGLFLVQAHGTAGSAGCSARSCWCGLLCSRCWASAASCSSPRMLLALNPLYGVALFVQRPGTGFVVLGAVFLAVTGAEALYADMGHFGRRPIRRAWLAVVFPALLLNYFGQGALLLGDPARCENPFYRLAPDWALYPLVALASLATIIASQAVISGAFSLTRQAIQLGYLPRLEIRHTSETEIGQVYVPRINSGAAGRGHRARARLQIVRQSRRRLRHRGQRHDGDHHRAGFSLHAQPRLEPRPGVAGVRLLADRPDLPRRQFVEDRRGRLVSDRRRGGVFAIMATWWRGRRLSRSCAPAMRCRCTVCRNVEAASGRCVCPARRSS